jgi:hypothetical protein
MKLWAMAGLFTAAAVPFAGVAEASAECQVDDSRRVPHVRIDDGGPGGSAPTIATPTAAPRDPAVRTVQRDPNDAAARVTPAERRRSGKHVPDAELIAPRGAL